MSGIIGIGPQTGAMQEVGAGSSLNGASASDGTSFADTLKQALGDVADVQLHAQDTIGAYLRGEPVELHEVMASAEEAGIALDMLVEVRNKIVDAYRTVMQMQS